MYVTYLYVGRGRRGATVQLLIVYGTVVSSIPTQGNEVLFINIFIIVTLVTRQSAALNSATRYEMFENATKREERSVVTLDSSCLFSYMLDVARI